MSPEPHPYDAASGAKVPQRVLVLVDTLAAGGAERVAVELACALDRDRFDPLVVATRTTGPLALHLQAHGVPHVVLGRRRRLDLRAWRRLRRLAAGADLVHAHKLGSNVWGAMLARRLGVPLVAHEHNFAGSDSWSQVFLDRNLVGGAATRVVCVSESVAATQARHGVHPHLLSIVPNGVRLEAAWPRSAARAELGLPEGGVPVLGIVGRLRPEKAHDVLLDAVAELVAAGRSLHLSIVGDGPCEAALRAQAARLGIEHAVTFAGERADAARLAAAFDLGVVASHWEGMPLAALESLAAGVPLVATAVGALPELVAPGAEVAPAADPLLESALAAGEAWHTARSQAASGTTPRSATPVDHVAGAPADPAVPPATYGAPTDAAARVAAAASAPAGALVPPGDPHALAAAIGRLLDDPTALRELGRAGQRRVREQYGFVRMVTRVQQVYDTALAEAEREGSASGPWLVADVVRAARGRNVDIVAPPRSGAEEEAA